jgi:hypothetical protein
MTSKYTLNEDRNAKFQSQLLQIGDLNRRLFSFLNDRYFYRAILLKIVPCEIIASQTILLLNQTFVRTELL